MFFRCLILFLTINSVTAQTSVTLSVTFDNKPQQTAWRIVDVNGNIYLPVDESVQFGTSNQNFETIEKEYNLGCGSYSFIFFDKRGNENIQGSVGFWQLLLADGTILAQQEDYSAWSFFHSTSFYIEDANCNNIYNLEIDFNDQTFCPNEQVNLNSSFELNSDLDFEPIGNLGNSFYYISNYTQRWYMADAIAKALGGNLVAINSAAENNFFNDINVDFWAGLIQKDFTTNQGANVGWEWSNGDPLTYENWNNNEPNNAFLNLADFPQEELFSGNNNTFLGNNANNLRERAMEVYPNLYWKDHSFNKFNRFIIEIEPIITWNTGEDTDNISITTTSNQSITAYLNVGDIADSDNVEINVLDIELADTVQYPCADDFPLQLFNLINSGNNISGSWTGPSILTGPPFLGTFDYYNSDGVYTYKYTDEDGCEIPFPINITKNNLSAGTDTIINLCIDDSEVSLFDYLGNNVEGNGFWSPTLAGDSQGIFNPQNNSSGLYTYTVSDSICNDSSEVNVNIIDINTGPINNTNQ